MHKSPQYLFFFLKENLLNILKEKEISQRRDK